MSKIARASVAALRGWGSSEQAARRASWPVLRLLLKPISALAIGTMVITQWVTGADDNPHLSIFAYGGLFLIGVFILITCVALGLGYRMRERGSQQPGHLLNQ